LKETAESEIDEAFFDALSKEGFERFSGEPLSYAKSSQDGQSRAHVDVEIREYLSGFGVTLQEVQARGTTRRQLLEDFQGQRAYRFERSKPETIKDAIAQALADLHFYGLPWLAGQSVSTPATNQLHQLVGERAYRDAVQAAREKFKAGDYAEAVRLFGEARAVRSLEAIDEKYWALAKKKLG
jgi:hypothetical protein